MSIGSSGVMIFDEFADDRMCRQQFREHALAGELPGVQKASW